MLTAQQEMIARRQIYLGLGVSPSIVTAMFETIESLRAQVEQLQIDLQQANTPQAQQRQIETVG